MQPIRPKKTVLSPEAKELQRFFNKASQVLLLPKPDHGSTQTSGLGLLFDKKTYSDWMRYGLTKTLSQLFAGTYPALIITVRDGTAFAGLAIRNLSSPLKFVFPDQPVGAALGAFMEATPDGAEIAMTVGYADKGNIIFESDSNASHLLTLRGYYFDDVQ